MTIDNLIAAHASPLSAGRTDASPRADANENAATENAAAQSAEEFEALVIAQFLEPLFATVDAPSLSGGPGAAAFDALLREHYAAAIAERGGFGVADSVKAALIDQQAAQQARLAVQGDR
ncbi:MAG: hypothetical protein AAGJ87_13205 [Pseudomonadota bacterium]